MSSISSKLLVAATLVTAELSMFLSTEAQSQGKAMPGTVIGAQSSDDVVNRAKLAVELGLLKASDPAKPGAAKRLDLVKLAVKSAQELMQAKKYPEALAKLADLDALADKTAEQIYLIERTRIALASLVNDDALLVKSMEAAIASGQTPAKERIEFMDLLARKYFNQKNYAKTIAWATRYVEEGGKDPSIRRAQLLAFYLNNDFARARQEVGADIQTEEIAGKKPSEEQLRLLVSVAQKLDDKVAYASAMEKYATYYPKKP